MTFSMRQGRAAPWLLVLLPMALAMAGCASRPAPARISRLWIAGHTEPAFDPDGPPDALRYALERLLARGLFERDSSGAVRAAAAERVEISADGRTVTLRLRPGLRAPDGTTFTSGDFRAALIGGLGRADSGTRAWLLQAIEGVDKVRAGRPLPALGIATPDEQTLVLHLVRRDPQLFEKLALPGVSTPWKHRAGGDWATASGLGAYRVLRHEPGREMVLVRADSAKIARALADTLRIRFVIGAPRARALLRHGQPDLVWPLPPALLAETLPAGYHAEVKDAAPVRQLLLVLRGDVPPTTKLEARHALAHVLRRTDLLAALGSRGKPGAGPLPGAGAFDFPSLDANETRTWLARGKFGASFHVVLAYDADGAGAEIARTLQGEWAALGLYAELRPLRGPAARMAPLAATAAQAQLVESQAPLAGAIAELAQFVMPLRGPAIGSFRSGWRTREFDPWLSGAESAGPLDAAAAQSRLAEERNILPLAELPWAWVVRDDAITAAFDPKYGPEFSIMNLRTRGTR